MSSADLRHDILLLGYMLASFWQVGGQAAPGGSSPAGHQSGLPHRGLEGQPLVTQAAHAQGMAWALGRMRGRDRGSERRELLPE